MGWIARWRPSAGSAGLVVACIALIAAVAGDSIAQVATQALSKKEKRQIRKIATEKLLELAPGLSVNHAGTANTANSANTARVASSADEVDGVSAANPFASAIEGDPRIVLATIGRVQLKLFCSGGIEQTILEARTTNGATAVYHEPGTGATTLFDGTDTTIRSALNQTRTITFTINAEGTPRTIVSGTLTLRHNASANACQIYGTLLGG